MASDQKIDILAGLPRSGQADLLRNMLATRYRGERVCVVLNGTQLPGVPGANALNDEDSQDSADAPAAPAAGLTAVQLPGGCLCCSGSRDLVAALDRALGGGEYDRISIVPAVTARLSDLLSIVSERTEKIGGDLDNVLTVADASSFSLRMQLSEDFIRAQLQCSPLLCLSGTHRVSAEDLEQIRSQVLGLCPDCVLLPEDPSAWDAAEGYPERRSRYKVRQSRPGSDPGAFRFGMDSPGSSRRPGARSIVRGDTGWAIRP